MEARARIINRALPVAVVSIHMNTYSSASRRGAQVFSTRRPRAGGCLPKPCRTTLTENLICPIRAENTPRSKPKIHFAVHVRSRGDYRVRISFESRGRSKPLFARIPRRTCLFDFYRYSRVCVFARNRLTAGSLLLLPRFRTRRAGRSFLIAERYSGFVDFARLISYNSVT